MRLARTRDDLVITAPESIELEAGEQQSVTLTAQADSIGVHPLRLIATDESGRPLGAAEEISVRSNKVGRIIWVIMGAARLLFGHPVPGHRRSAWCARVPRRTRAS